MVTRQKLLSSPRSGARPLGAAPPVTPRRQARRSRPPSTNTPPATPAPAPTAAPPAAGAPPQQPPQQAAPPQPPGRARAAAVTESGAGFILGLILWGFARNWIAGGSSQAWGWVAAKMINQPYTGKTAPPQRTTPLAPAAPAGPG